MPWLNELDAKRDEIQEQCPGWQVWYVTSHNRTVTWCARPNPLINADSPEHLVEAIRDAHAAGQHPALGTACGTGS